MSLFKKNKKTHRQQASEPRPEVTVDTDVEDALEAATSKPGEAVKPEPKPQEVIDKEDYDNTPQLSEDGPKIYFSRWKGYKIGMVPSTVTYDIVNGIRRKSVNKGQKICFTNGRYVAKNKTEEEFLDNFMKEYPDRIFSIDPEQQELQLKLAQVVASHKAAKSMVSKGKQGAVGGR